MDTHEGRYHAGQAPKGQAGSVMDERGEPWPMKGGRISTFRAWDRGADWKELVGLLGSAAWQGSGIADRCLVEVRGVHEKLGATDQDLALELEDAVYRLVGQAAIFGTLVGYALSKTYPTGLEQMNDWVEAALDFADLRGFPGLERSDRDEDRASDEPPMEKAG